MAIQDFLFGKTNYKPISISEPLRDSIDLTTGQSLGRFRRRKDQTLDAFGELARRTLPRIEGAVDQGLADVDAASSMLRGFNPLGTYETLRGGNIQALTGLADTLSGVGRREERALSARLGLAGRPRSSARDLIRSTGTATAFAPIANTIFANLGGDVTRLGQQVGSTASGLGALAMLRPDLYGSLYNYALAPIEAEAAGLGVETSALNALADAIRKNYAGMDVQKKMGLMDYPVRMSESLAGTVGNLADAAGSVTSLFGMGGLGGLGGLGGMFGGGGGGGGVYDVNQMNPLQQLMMWNARRAGSVNVPQGSVWE